MTGFHWRSAAGLLRTGRAWAGVYRRQLNTTAVHCCHSSSAWSRHSNKMRIQILSALEDNYMYLLVDESSKQAAIVDPVNPEKVVDAVKQLNDIRLTTVLTTHHHWDHAGGNEKLGSLVDGLTVYGGDERIPCVTHRLKNGDTFKIGEMSVRAMHTPCHTTGHICYYITSPTLDTPAVFTGDTLFIGGCGRFFEGTAEQMQAALSSLGALDPSTKVYCGHEYTVSNLKYAVNVEPDNQTLRQKLAEAEADRAAGRPTVPSDIRGELAFNPFMRTNVASVQKHTRRSNPVDTMAALREEKNSFKPKL
eukprot:scpid71379/ scgid10553/ Hydroxyacylglutathione hydrolase, mitochondrial; Glyoxalase II